VLLELALSKLMDKGRLKKDGELGAIRIALLQSMDLSRGNVATVARSLREQVAVIRKGQIRDPGNPHEELVVSHEPVGKLEHAFDFDSLAKDDKQAEKEDRPRPKSSRLRIASAANLIDTLTAKHTCARRGLRPSRIESYIEMGTINRIAYQFASALSPFTSSPLARSAIAAELTLLPDGPAPSDLQSNVVVLEIEDPYHERLIDWRWETPNVYQFTAQLAVAVAIGVATLGARRPGWLTPADALSLGGPDNVKSALRDCDGPEERQNEKLL
jgi:hypothetical protein